MESFENYLVKRGFYSDTYIKAMLKRNLIFENWLKTNDLNIETLEYKDLTDFILYLQQQNASKHKINRILQTITHYYYYKALPNLAKDVRVRGIIRTQPSNLLTKKELDLIYDNFEAQSKRSINRFSDKLILGLIIYQGLDMREFMHMEISDLNLEKGEIYIREFRDRRSRTIALRANQILLFNDFITRDRPMICNTESERLFSPRSDSYNSLHEQFKQLSKSVKKQASEKLGIDIVQLCKLRHSRISVWVSEYGIRKAQYLAGFRRISSAERYRRVSLEDLKEQIRMHHPLK